MWQVLDVFGLATSELRQKGLSLATFPTQLGSTYCSTYS